MVSLYGKFVAGYKYIVFNGKLVGKYTNAMPSVWVGDACLSCVVCLGSLDTKKRVRKVESGRREDHGDQNCIPAPSKRCQLDPKGW